MAWTTSVSAGGGRAAAPVSATTAEAVLRGSRGLELRRRPAEKHGVLRPQRCVRCKLTCASRINGTGVRHVCGRKSKLWVNRSQNAYKLVWPHDGALSRPCASVLRGGRRVLAARWRAARPRSRPGVATGARIKLAQGYEPSRIDVKRARRASSRPRDQRGVRRESRRRRGRRAGWITGGGSKRFESGRHGRCRWTKVL